MQAEYWRRRGNSDKENGGVSYVEYGNDVEGTAFCDKDSDDPLGRSAWNMRVRLSVQAAEGSEKLHCRPIWHLSSNDLPMEEGALPPCIWTGSKAQSWYHAHVA